MQADLELIAHEIKELSRMVTDKAAIAHFINKCHGTNYFASDIEKIQLGIKPTSSIPRNLAGVRVIVGEPIAWSPPISTIRGGTDPLAKACLEYGIKHGGVMGASANDCESMLKALAA